jgi:hypothetical protein
LTLLLGIVALLGLRPWTTDSVTPNLIVPPGGGAGVGDATAVPRVPTLAVAPGRAVAAPGPAVGAALVSTPVSGSAHPVLAVAPARALASAPQPPASPTQPQPPVEAPEQPAPQPVSAPPEPPAPVLAEATPPPAETGGPGGPIVAGVEPPEEPSGVCEGTDYEVTVAFDVEAIFGDRTDAEIVLRRVGSDGSEVELHVEGGLDDLLALLDQFDSEGPCVTVGFEPLASDGAAQPEQPSEPPEPILP